MNAKSPSVVLDMKKHVFESGPLPMPTLYLVRNKEGKYFRTKGYGGHGKSWVDGMETAKIYGKIGPARATVTFFATNYP